VVIKRFEWRYKNRYEFPYDIELELAPTANSLQSLVPAQVNAPTLTTATAAPQKTYIVVAGDSLWKIAQTYYGDGSQYKKIAAANKISNPDLIQIGQKLVIP
jgi:5'-nucleotidase/UDP-sugar diphosphatase